MAEIYESTSMKRVLATPSPQGSFTLAVDVVNNVDDTAAIKAIPCGSALAAVIVFTGTGDADDVFDCKVWGEFPLVSTDGRPTREASRFLLGTATCTLSANTGATSGVAIASTEKVVDTITWSIGAFLTAAEAAFSEGASGAYSPANDLVACLFLPCLARCSRLLFEFDMTTGAPTGGNAHVCLRRI